RRAGQRGGAEPGHAPVPGQGDHRGAARRAGRQGGVRPPGRGVGGGHRDRLPGQRLLDLHDRRDRERQLAAPVMPATVLDGLDEVRAAVGRPLGTTGWTEVTAEQVARFDRAVGAADRDDDGGGDEVPRYLVLALTNLFMPQLVEVRGVALGVNYGTG